MGLKGKRIAVLVEDLYQEMEVWYPVYRFREEGAIVTIVGPKAQVYSSKLGYPITAEAAAASVRGKDFDAVIVPGGYAPDRMRLHPPMVDLVRDAYRAGRVVAAICHGGWVLASAGIVRGKTVTAYAAIKDDMVNAGATFVDREVVRDANLVTSRKPDDLPSFCRAIREALLSPAGF